MLRVYDKYEKCWVDNALLASNGDIYIFKNSLFGKKLKLTSPERYIYHKDINLWDKDNNLIYEGDMVEATVSEDTTVTGMVAYARELAGYVILCSDCEKWYSLGSEVCQYVKVVGNVFDDVGEK